MKFKNVFNKYLLLLIFVFTFVSDFVFAQSAPRPPSPPSPPRPPSAPRPPGTPPRPPNSGGGGACLTPPVNAVINMKSCQLQPQWCGCEVYPKIPKVGPQRNRIKMEDLAEFPEAAPSMAQYQNLGYCTGEVEVVRSASLKNGGGDGLYSTSVKRKYTLKMKKEKDPETGLVFLKTKMIEYDDYGKLKDCSPPSQTTESYKSKTRAVNAPTLFFNEGEEAEIKVINEDSSDYKSSGTSIHWHGLILPNDQDGIIGITQKPIMPGTSKTYKFKIVQNGTYWYHPHDLNEQDTKGAFIIFPNVSKENADNARRIKNKKGKISFGGVGAPYHHDRVVFLSDYKNNQDSQQILSSLLNHELQNRYEYDSKIHRQWMNNPQCKEEYFNNFSFMKMFYMDPADIWYTSFFMNDETCLNCGGVVNQLKDVPVNLNKKAQKISTEFSQFKKGEKVRLRIINGSASSYFYLDYANNSQLTFENKLDMLVVAKDGLPVAPIYTDQLYVGMGETYDVIVDIKEDNTLYEFRAKSIDDMDDVEGQKGRRAARLLLGSRSEDKNNPTQVVSARNVPVQFCGPYSEENNKISQLSYDKLNMLNPNDPVYNFEVYHAEAPIEQYYISLSGNMEDYYWTISPSSKAKLETEAKAKDQSLLRSLLESFKSSVPSLYNFAIKGDEKKGTVFKYDSMDMPYLVINEGKRIRITIKNDMVLGMMNHPWHLHGNWFRLVEEGDTDAVVAQKALLHTATIFPGETKTLEFYSDPEYRGAWMFHCHNLYHMANDMMMYLRYSTTSDEEMTRMTGMNPIHGSHGPLLKNQTVTFGAAAYEGTDARGGGVNMKYRGTLGRGLGYVDLEMDLTSDQLKIINNKGFGLESKLRYCFEVNKCVSLSLEYDDEGAGGGSNATTYVGGELRPYNSEILILKAGAGATCESNSEGHGGHNQTTCNPALMTEVSSTWDLVAYTKVRGRIGCEGEYCKEFYFGLDSKVQAHPRITLVPFDCRVSNNFEEGSYCKAEVRIMTDAIPFGSSH